MARGEHPDGGAAEAGSAVPGRPGLPHPVRVVLADDAPLVREGVAHVLRSAGIEVQAQVGDGEALLEAVARWLPDVAVVDVRMPPTGTDEGLRAAARIQRTHPATGVLLLSNHCETRHLDQVLRAAPSGVGYLLKERIADLGAFVDAVRTVAAGGEVVDRQVLRALLASQRAHGGVMSLTVRERDVLAAMASGASNYALSDRLGLSLKTVETHASSIFRKLGLGEDPGEHRRVKAVLVHLLSDAAATGGR